MLCLHEAHEALDGEGANVLSITGPHTVLTSRRKRSAWLRVPPALK